MKRRSNLSLGWQVGLGFTLLGGICALAIALYAFQARQHLGANYTALVADVVRPQLHTALLRTTLDSVRHPLQDPELIERLNNLLWRIPRHIEGVSFGLSTSRLEPADYEASLERLQRVNERIPVVQQHLDDVASGKPPDALIQQGYAIENELALAYSELSELLHFEAGKQRIFMERLAIVIGVLVFVILSLMAGLLLALLRLNREHERVTRLSQADELTGLGNRRYLLNCMDALYLQHQDEASSLSLALLDIDHFKQVNDSFGHPAGDRILQVFAEALMSASRKGDIVARLGGEEFCVLMPDTGANGALELAERIRQRIAMLSHQQLGVPTSVTVSLGLATVNRGDVSFERLYSRADKALYQAKIQGRNRVEEG
ncbi:diguanylate cyclase [Vreelandella aquamarina]